MPPTLKSFVIAGAAMASLAVLLDAGDASAGWKSHKRVVIVHPQFDPYAPYYYSRWNPYSIYSVYDHLSGGRELCYLATDPCDNNHRMQN
jgi:hypothetical protein